MPTVVITLLFSLIVAAAVLFFVLRPTARPSHPGAGGDGFIGGLFAAAREPHNASTPPRESTDAPVAGVVDSQTIATPVAQMGIGIQISSDNADHFELTMGRHRPLIEMGVPSDTQVGPRHGR